MGQFIITRTPKGDRFQLKSDSGRTLAVSRHYATLDACKKGIASLVINAPLMPVVDAAAGEYGPNPKFEIVGADGGLSFWVKSPNGKTVITSPVYATKKACLRAISMLRQGVVDFEILFYSKEGYTPLTMKSLEGITPVPTPKAFSTSVEVPNGASEAGEPEEALDMPVVEEPEEALDMPVVQAPEKISVAPASDSALAPAPSPTKSPLVPRLIRLQPRSGATPKATRESENVRNLGGIFDRIFKK